MGKKFNHRIESSFLQYLDANNLYGWAMSQKLPTGGFKWVKKLDDFMLEMIAELSMVREAIS